VPDLLIFRYVRNIAAGLGKEESSAETGCDEAMQAGEQEERNEQMEVTLANARTHPRAVMILLFDADAA